MDEAGTLAVFAEPGQAAQAVRALRAAGMADIRVAMPAPFPNVMEALGKGRSRMGVGVFAATVIGLAAGLTLCIATSLAWPIVVGGKPIVAIPTFVVIGFEVAVLIGGSATHALLAYTTVTGRYGHRIPVKDERFSRDRVGVFVVSRSASVEEVFKAHGAEEVRHVG